jgi:dolichol-phosphate mannosyltransferase
MLGSIFVGLPAFNEEIAIERLLLKLQSVAALLPRSLRIVVYNDGSTDRTAEIATAWMDRLPITVIGEATNRGLGAGVRSLIRYVLQNASETDVLVIMDCDDTHDPDQIRTMIAALDQGCDVIIASRYRAGATVRGVPLLRRITAVGAMVLMKSMHPIPGALDYTCGYRAYRVALLQKAWSRFGENLIENRGFSCMAELLVKLSTLHPKVAEVPLRLRYDLKPTCSKMHVGDNVLQLLKSMIRWRLRGFDMRAPKESERQAP